MPECTLRTVTLCPIHTVQTSNMQYTLSEYNFMGSFMYLEFYSVFSEPFINDEIFAL